MVGYQGWFTCAGDGKPLDPRSSPLYYDESSPLILTLVALDHHGWLHWITQPLDAGGRPNTDLWYDTSSERRPDVIISSCYS